jgi:hypothetical protein
MGRITHASLTVGVVLIALVGCGGGGGGTSSATHSAPATGSAPAASGPATGSGPADRAAAERQVRENWQKFFSPDTSVSDKAGLLQNGDQLKLLLQALSSDSRVAQVKAEVKTVGFTSPTEADVTYALSLDSSAVLPNASGTSVLQDGTWKVAVKSLCALSSIDASGPRAPGC